MRVSWDSNRCKLETDYVRRERGSREREELTQDTFFMPIILDYFCVALADLGDVTHAHQVRLDRDSQLFIYVWKAAEAVLFW